MKKTLSVFLLLFASVCNLFSQFPSEKRNLKFNNMPIVWDEAMPLGNGFIGALIWEKEGKLRISLDRADLWDETFVQNFDIPQFSYHWVFEQVKKKSYDTVQKLFDLPYEKYPTPTKIPCAALEFDISSLGKVDHVELDIKTALCTIVWKNGVIFKTYVHGERQIGWYKFEGLKKEIIPILIPPKYVSDKIGKNVKSNSVEGSDLVNLGYPAPIVEQKPNQIKYIQKVKNLYEYSVTVKWKKGKNSFEGRWTIDNSKPYLEQKESLSDSNIGFEKDFVSHKKWWSEFWSKSEIKIPDAKLEKQWYLELYKFGSSARENTPPITLQGVWTADNGKIPPWKGDFHNDLNTQLSYWPSYSGNHLTEANGFVKWLWKISDEGKKYTKKYFGCDGLNIPGVSTISGKAMGGWIQYSLSPTTSSWLAQHFYLQWRYSMDRKFLAERAYPFLKETALLLENITIRDENGKRKLPISSSPEINDNQINAWFYDNTNFDLALMKWVFIKSAELAREMKDEEKARHYESIAKEFPEFSSSAEDGLLLTKNYPLKESHRHFSHLMAIHPLGLLKWENGAEDRLIIKSSLQHLEKTGTKWWCGYSFSWLGSMYARAKDGDKAFSALKTFADCFCLPNSFHANGDQSGTGKSDFTYRPFTLEGNFAFAASLQEMLLQSYSGIIEVFPAIPGNWKNLSFRDLRAEGAFLISAEMKDGLTEKLVVVSEKGGKLKLKNPFKNYKCYSDKNISDVVLNKEIIEISMKPKSRLVLNSGK